MIRSDWELLSAYDISLEGTELFDQKFIKISLPYNTNFVGIDPSAITVRYWNENLQEWSDTGISDVVL